jgi:hypothetical protein
MSCTARWVVRSAASGAAGAAKSGHPAVPQHFNNQPYCPPLRLRTTQHATPCAAAAKLCSSRPLCALGWGCFADLPAMCGLLDSMQGRCVYPLRPTMLAPPLRLHTTQLAACLHSSTAPPPRSGCVGGRGRIGVGVGVGLSLGHSLCCWWLVVCCHAPELLPDLTTAAGHQICCQWLVHCCFATERLPDLTAGCRALNLLPVPMPAG